MMGRYGTALHGERKYSTLTGMVAGETAERARLRWFHEVQELTLGDRVAAEVRAWMVKRQVNGEDLSERLGVSRAYISRRLKGETSFNLEDLASIAFAMSVPLTVLLRQPLQAFDGDLSRTQALEAEQIMRRYDAMVATGEVAPNDQDEVQHDPIPITAGKGTTKGSCSTAAGSDVVRPLATATRADGSIHSAEWLRAS